MNSNSHPNGRRFCPPLLLLILAVLFPVAWLAVAKPKKAEARELKREMGYDAPSAKSSKREANSDSTGGKPNSSDTESRVMSKLRERLEVTDDGEWAIIAERITRVEEVRRSLWAGSAGGRGGASFSEKSKRSSRPGGSAHPEQDALRSAVGDKLPDAEIKVRLARAHEVFQQNEALLLKVQTELRAILTVRQEAVAVMAGLLPP
jgi:hypothetical protein